ncbi:calcitonin gene-related peptide type 1 receptor-like [Liolophura sinensis]|uniref:calcitonin gene-related peptide type 1 receptor-like n=1 Tax=Liolophura sinensis TaxID=3198878 RepID=UPI003157F73B
MLAETPAGEVASIPCPPHPVFDTSRFAHKECMENGSWFVDPESLTEWANYSECINQETHMYEPDYGPIHAFVGGYALSIVMLLAATAIMCSFRQLRCERNALHKHLFVSFILNGICWILYFLVAVTNGHVLITNPIWCQFLHCICNYFAVCNFFWMFCEGFYLHTLIVSAFHTGKLFMACCILGWGAPFLLIVIYCVIRATDDGHTEHCWSGNSVYVWIIYGPVITSLLANFAFLINIIRVIIRKLRDFDAPNTSQTRKAVRATIILVPLLGLQYLLLPFRPSEDSGFQETYAYLSALVTSLQGALVALIYCFLNGEVISVIKRRWQQINLMEGRSVRLQGALVWPPTSMTYMESHTADKKDYGVSKSRHTEDFGEGALELEKLNGDVTADKTSSHRC